ncbi:hypothetical protein UK12_27300 [Saccharothrix sp. ST-888]|nr:hypothetical protein UK12_27300 [Saccharothrix sp. ST-888]
MGLRGRWCGQLRSARWLSRIANRHKDGDADAVRDKQQLEARSRLWRAGLAQLLTAEEAHQS